VTALLEVKDVSKRFGGLMASSHLTFAIAKGEILGLIGPNGAGKTTLFNLINGYFRPTSGEIYFRGERIDRLRPYESREKTDDTVLEVDNIVREGKGLGPRKSCFISRA